MFVLPSWSGSCQAGWGRIGARTPILPGADIEVGSQLWHLSSGVRVGGRARGFLPGITELGRGAGRVAAEPRPCTKPDSQAVSKEGVELTVHGRERDWGPLLPGTAGSSCLKVAGDSQGSLWQRLWRGAEARGAHPVTHSTHHRAWLTAGAYLCWLRQRLSLHLQQALHCHLQGRFENLLTMYNKWYQSVSCLVWQVVLLFTLKFEYSWSQKVSTFQTFFRPWQYTLLFKSLKSAVILIFFIFPSIMAILTETKQYNSNIKCISYMWNSFGPKRRTTKWLKLPFGRCPQCCMTGENTVSY